MERYGKEGWLGCGRGKNKMIDERAERLKIDERAERLKKAIREENFEEIWKIRGEERIK